MSLKFAQKHSISSAADVSEDMRRILRSLDEMTDGNGVTNDTLNNIQELSGLNYISFMCGFSKLIKSKIITILAAGIIIVNYGLLNRRSPVPEKIGHHSCQCGECAETQAFECNGCGMIAPYCRGSDDELFEYCDYCVLAMIAMGAK